MPTWFLDHGLIAKEEKRMSFKPFLLGSVDAVADGMSALDPLIDFNCLL